MPHLAEVGETETTDSECVYCQQTTTWLITVLPGRRLRYECTRCCKISRDVVVATNEAEEADHDTAGRTPGPRLHH